MTSYVNIEQAAELILRGDVVALPTETVYGLAADATQDTAVARIYQTKQRPQFNPLIIHVASIEQANKYVALDERVFPLIEAFWPGPLTLVLPLRNHSPISKLASAGLDTLAIRMPQHPVMRAVIEATQKPLAAPSANPSLCISPTTAQHVIKAFEGQVPVLDGGQCECGLESTIIDLSVDIPTLLRPGPIAVEHIQSVIGYVETTSSQHIKAPGQMRRHYAPKKPLRLNAVSVNADEGLIAFGPHVPPGAMKVMNLSESGDLVEAATHLFDFLHAMDASDVKCIAVMPIPEIGLGIAIHDRLGRAAAE